MNLSRIQDRRTFFSDYGKIDRLVKLLLVQAEKFADPPFDPIACYRVTNFSTDSHSKPRPTASIFPA